MFIVSCSENDPLFEEEALFTIPEKAMEMSMFMTLDEYMENKTRFAEWDRMNQSVLAAGRTEEGQQVIPLCYTFPASIYRAEEVTHEPSKEITREEMLQSDDAALRATAVRTDNTSEYSEGMPFMVSRGPMIEFVLGDLADYGEEELSFSEEELEMRIKEIVELADEYKAGGFADAPVHYNDFIGLNFDILEETIDTVFGGNAYDSRNGIKWNDKYTMIPLYSDDGGVTAEISTFAAINRNTEYADEAFLLLDYMSSYTVQQNENMYASAIYCTGINSTIKNYIPMYDEMLSSDSSVDYYYLRDDNYAEFCTVRDQITNVNFRNAVGTELTQIYRDYESAIRHGRSTGGIISEGYENLKRIIKE